MAAMGKEIELAIVFADVVGSTKLYELLGDLRARDMVGICIDVMRAATDQNHGTVIKTMGDEVMSTFPTADDALNAAAQMQKQITLHPQLKVDEQTVAIRIGCNFGAVVLENRDIFGSAVHTANRMTSQAKAGQIITTATMVERLSSDWRASVRQIDIATLKGRSSEVALFEVLWQTEDITSMVPAIAITSRERERAGKSQRLRLRYQGQEVLVTEGRANITIGRAEENDLVVKGNLISRLHARVEINRNKFMLIDQSTNGTFVLGKDGEEAFVRRDSMQIRGEGLIGLGKAPDSNSSQVIRYICEE
jgi:adenylate cyclase